MYSTMKDKRTSTMRKLNTECDFRRATRVLGAATRSTAVDDGLIMTAGTRSRFGHVWLPVDGPVDKAIDAPILPASESGPCHRRASVVVSGIQTHYGTLSRGRTNDVRVTSVVTVDGHFVEVEKPTSIFRRVMASVSRRLRRDNWRWPPADTASIAETIDRYSRFAFPFMFVVLSSVYWSVYLQIRPTVVREPDFVVVDDG